ncbi:MAG TPA: thioesterase family protein [Candidatus Binatia bacterium]|nr:thioesterase family protein [Candidatus Binatia bacterium]
MCYHARVVSRVYTAHVTVRHDEVDRFGHVHPGVYLRYLAHAAVEASAAAGFDRDWYAAAGGMWIIRRSTVDVIDALRAEERVAIATWVEDFRRVRSHRRYTIDGADGRPRLAARTDWVYVDVATGRPRRVPQEFEAACGLEPGHGPERAAWEAPAAPAVPAVTTHRVRACELDAIGHVNNAVYLDLLAQAVLDAFENVGWPLEQLVGAGTVPRLAGADVEYLDGALYGDRLELATWFAPADGSLEAHHHIVRAGADRPLVRATTRWRWMPVAHDTSTGVPAGLLAALAPVLAA